MVLLPEALQEEDEEKYAIYYGSKIDVEQSDEHQFVNF